MRCGQGDHKRATAVGGVGGDAAGDPAGGVAGGGRGDAAGGLGRRAPPGPIADGPGHQAPPGPIPDGPGHQAPPGPTADGPGHQAPPGPTADGPGHQAPPGLAAYLLIPRRDTWAKALMAPACFVVAAGSTGHFGGWARFVVLWLVLELLIYPARYQWNDIAGVDSDQRHPEASARSRLPAGSTPQARRRSIRLSWLTAAARVLAALLVGWLTGLTGPVLVLAGAVFIIAGSYEWLRASRNRHWTPARVVAVWLAVGLGYLVRGGLGLSSGGLPWGSAAMAATLVCLGAFGIMFVLLTWALEATSYCAADGDGRWHARPELAAKPHLAALLRHLGEPLGPGGLPLGPGGLPPGAGRYCGGDRVLRGGSRLAAPWNLALLAAAASGAAAGAALARPHAAGAVAWIAAAAVGLAGGVVLARCRSARGRWAVAAAWFAAVVGIGLVARPALPVLAGLPWLAVAGLYCAFSGWSYRELVAASPGRQRQRRA